MYNENNDNTLIFMLNGAGVVVAYGLLALSLYMSPDVPLATKGYWGMGILLLTISLVNIVKYRLEWKSNSDRIRKIEDAKNDKILDDALNEI